MTWIANGIWSGVKQKRIPLWYYFRTSWTFPYQDRVAAPLQHTPPITEISTAFQDTIQSSDGILMSSSLSDSESIPESQKFMMHQIIRMATNPEAAPTETRIFVVAFLKVNSNRATKNAQTLSKSVIVTIWRTWTRNTTTHDHISRAYVRLNMTANGSR